MCLNIINLKYFIVEKMSFIILIVVYWFFPLLFNSFCKRCIYFYQIIGIITPQNTLLFSLRFPLTCYPPCIFFMFTGYCFSQIQSTSFDLCSKRIFTRRSPYGILTWLWSGCRSLELQKERGSWVVKRFRTEVSRAFR